MPTVLDDKSRTEVELTDVAEREIQSSPAPAPLADVSAESPPDAAEAEQEREPQASSPGVDAAARVEADDPAEGAGQPGEAGIDSQRPDSSWSKRSTAEQSASDPPDGGPKTEPGVSELQDMLNEDDPMTTMAEFETMEPEKPFVFESPGDAAGADPAPKSKLKSKPRSKPRAAPGSKRPASGESRRRGESEAKTPEPAENDGSATYKLCAKTVNTLNDPECKLPVEAREAMMQSSLAVLLTEFALHEDGMLFLIDALHHADAGAYAKFAKSLVERGIFMGTGVLDSLVRYAWNKVAMVRPCFIDDLELSEIDDIARLDSGLAAYLQHLQLTAEVKRSNWSEHNRDLKRVAQLAQVNSAAQSSLKLYLGILKEFRRAKSQRDAEVSSRQRKSPSRSRRPVRLVPETAAGEEILSEYEEANSADSSSHTSARQTEDRS